MVTTYNYRVIKRWIQTTMQLTGHTPKMSSGEIAFHCGHEETTY